MIEYTKLAAIEPLIAPIAPSQERDPSSIQDFVDEVTSSAMADESRKLLPFDSGCFVL